MTNDLEKRLNKHITGNGAKYTKSHKAEKIEIAWRSKDKSLACKLEYQLKKLSKSQKENIIDGTKLSVYLKGKVDCRRYIVIKNMKKCKNNSYIRPENMVQFLLY